MIPANVRILIFYWIVLLGLDEKVVCACQIRKLAFLKAAKKNVIPDFTDKHSLIFIWIVKLIKQMLWPIWKLVGLHVYVMFTIAQWQNS